MASERVQRQIERLLDEAEEASAQRQWEVVRDRAEHTYIDITPAYSLSTPR